MYDLNKSEIMELFHFDTAARVISEAYVAPPIPVRISVSQPSSRKIADGSPVVAEKANIMPFEEGSPFDGLS